MFEAVEMPEDKASFYRILVAQAKALTEGETDTLANLSNVASLIFTTMAKVNWAGFYIARGDQLVLGPFMGNPACVRIPMGRGVCGTAAQEQTTQMVDDVNAFPGHIACDSASQSEIVIPFSENGEIKAVLDIDSPITCRFDEEDRKGLEALAAMLAERIQLNQLNY
ncbi:GAF domain-containing protein [Endozoicomonas numazuensis]|uniref:GAF domain-containing protein n=1 Tax=Endozoicomonas numazuensis TaxID=1137799 RepID=UPI0005564507|nr:GAF domain-containing protein [Endozoicomonas numazuensis]